MRLMEFLRKQKRLLIDRYWGWRIGWSFCGWRQEGDKVYVRIRGIGFFKLNKSPIIELEYVIDKSTLPQCV